MTADRDDWTPERLDRLFDALVSCACDRHDVRTGDASACDSPVTHWVKWSSPTIPDGCTGLMCSEHSEYAQARMPDLGYTITAEELS